MSVGFTFRVGVLKLQSEDAPRLEKAVQGIRRSTNEGLRHMRAREAAMRRLRSALLRAAEDAFVRG